MKQAILFLSDKSSQSIINNFKSISIIGNNETDVFFLYHQKTPNIPNAITSLKHYYTFTSNILHELDYKPLKESLLPGSNHFPLLKFYLEHPQYDYYWMIEDDVYFTGNWEVLFKTYQNHSVDFISTHVEKYSESPQWYWWYTLKIHNENISNTNKIHSFNPIYRLSNRALKCIDKALKSGWSGHHEVLIPTLLHCSGYTIIDMGGNGSFVIKGFKKQFYDTTTMSHLPIKLGKKDNYIYHPVKEKKTIDMNKLKKNCIISAVGKNSIHREWIKNTPDFDLHLIVYDNSYNKFNNDTDFITYSKGYKFKLVYNYLQNHPEYIEKYNYFFIPDDDIQMDTQNISKFFQLMEKYNLQIAQPGISNSYYSYEHTLRDKLCLLRYTNFVEIMLPCFSRDALKKVLPTFNENDSAWGIENHWPLLINSTGKDIAIIDQLYAVHTRPIQSYNTKNLNELNEYVKKYKLNRNIIENGFIESKSIKQSESLTTDRTIYKFIENINDLIAEYFLKLIRTPGTYHIGLTGAAGISLFLANHSRISEKKKYFDKALSIIEKTSNKLGNIKDNLNFKDGLPGYSWYIEYLVQQGFIENNTDEIMEGVCEYFNRHLCERTIVYNIQGLTGIIPHYIARIKNPHFNQNVKLHREEKKILVNLIHKMNKWSENLPILKTNTHSKDILNSILLLHQIKKRLHIHGIDSTLDRLTHQIEYINTNSEFPYLLKVYGIIVASDSTGNKELKNKIINDALEYNEYFKDTNFQQILNLYLLHRIYIYTKKEAFRSQGLELLQAMIKKHTNVSSMFSHIIGIAEEKENPININHLIQVGLILTSLLSEKEVELDMCIL